MKFNKNKFWYGIPAYTAPLQALPVSQYQMAVIIDVIGYEIKHGADRHSLPIICLFCELCSENTENF
jgi:hypothetical protein